MSKRDIIGEILSKKRRLPFEPSHRWDLVSERLHCLRQSQDLLDILGNKDSESDDLFDAYAESKGATTIDSTVLDSPVAELTRYVPVGLVACIEGYFRIAYASLLDHGSPYRENASKLDLRFNLDIGTAFALQRHSVSLGEFVAHMLGTSSLEYINRIMSTLIGEDFLDLFKRKRPGFRLQETLFPLDEDAISNRMIADLRQLFELRHVYAHEIDPRFEDDDVVSIPGGAETTFEFLWTVEQIMNEMLNKKAC